MDKSVDAVKKSLRRSSDRKPINASWPACPRCGDLCDPRDFRCPSCRCRLYLD